MPSIFLSYRRSDTPGHAGRLYDRLADRFGETNVFMDLDSLEPGADFTEIIEATVARCDALVAVIGPGWLEAGTPDGTRRLDDPLDWVRIEIANALHRRIRVVPVLVHGATMPKADELPEDIRPLARRHAIALSESTWAGQVDQLINGLTRPLAPEPPPEVKVAPPPPPPPPTKADPKPPPPADPPPAAIRPAPDRRLAKRLAAAAAVLAVGVLIAILVASGDDPPPTDSPSAAKGNTDTVSLGTTDVVVSLDPAGAYDLGSQQLIGNVYQNLLSIPPGSNKPAPDAAESCRFSNPTTYVCTLKPGLRFSDGESLTSKDVKFSLDRQSTISDASGPVSLLASLDSVEVPDLLTVTMHLKRPDSTWPFVLTHTVAAIVPDEVYPADAKQPDGKVIGSGPYKLDRYEPGKQAVFSVNPRYSGPTPLTPHVVVRYYSDSEKLKQAIEAGTVDVAYRNLSPEQVEDLRGEGDKGVTVVDGASTEIRYIVFNISKAPVDQLAVRQAIAEVIDRKAMTSEIYRDTADPLYSMVPGVLPGAKESFKDSYGDGDAKQAKASLARAGVKVPVKLDAWYTPTHYGPQEADLWFEIKRQLEASGLFEVTLDNEEWDPYKQAAFADHKYYMYGLGWFPDFPDADNYLSPFLREGGFLQNGFSSQAVNSALDDELGSSNSNRREVAFRRLQDLTAKDIPMIPLWQAKQIAAVRDGVVGVDKTLDAGFLFRFAGVSKTESAPDP